MMLLKLPDCSWDYFSAPTNSNVTCVCDYIEFLLLGKSRKLFCPEISSQVYALQVENNFSQCVKCRQDIVFLLYFISHSYHLKKGNVFSLSIFIVV